MCATLVRETNSLIHDFENMHIIRSLCRDPHIYPTFLAVHTLSVCQKTWKQNPQNGVLSENVLTTSSKNPGQSVQLPLFLSYQHNHCRQNSGSNCALRFFLAFKLFWQQKAQLPSANTSRCKIRILAPPFHHFVPL